MAGEDYSLCQLLSYAIAGSDQNAADDEIINGDMLTYTYDRCYQLMTRDYECEELNNPNGHLCSTYPAKMIIPQEKNQCNKVMKLTDYVLKGRFARTRGRFVVPVLMVNGKFVCRSSTLARSPEIYCRRSYGYWVQGEVLDVDSKRASDENISTVNSDQKNSLECTSAPSDDMLLPTDKFSNDLQLIGDSEDRKSKEWLLDKMRNADINLLHFLNVDTIFDLMVENKKVKFGMNVTSSEKVDRQQRYLDFNLLSVPYPGCEFFAEYQKHNHSGEGLLFDWKQNFVDADLHVPNNVKHLSDVDWGDYVNWDLIKLTQNYLKLFLHSVMGEDSTGILLHCISGWDRTPLFVSLIRLSLWADGLVHNSLSAEEMVYFTVAYDWLLFNHQFSDRITNGEEIFYFCFDFLKYIDSEDYSMVAYYQNGSGHIVPEGNGQESEKLSEDVCVILDKSELEDCEADDDRSRITNHISSCTNNAAVVDVNEVCYWNKAEHLETSNCAITPGPTSLDMKNINGNVGHKSEYSKLDHEANNGSSLFKECDNSAKKEKQNHRTSERTETMRHKRLSNAREIAIKAYQEALQCHHDREQRSTSGFAAVLYHQLTKTLNLVKR